MHAHKYKLLMHDGLIFETLENHDTWKNKIFRIMQDILNAKMVTLI